MKLQPAPAENRYPSRQLGADGSTEKRLYLSSIAAPPFEYGLRHPAQDAYQLARASALYERSHALPLSLLVGRPIL